MTVVFSKDLVEIASFVTARANDRKDLIISLELVNQTIFILVTDQNGPLLYLPISMRYNELVSITDAVFPKS